MTTENNQLPNNSETSTRSVDVEPVVRFRPERTFIIAATDVQYRRYLRDNELNQRDYPRLLDAVKLRGIKSPKVIRICWWDDVQCYRITDDDLRAIRAIVSVDIEVT